MAPLEQFWAFPGHAAFGIVEELALAGSWERLAEGAENVLRQARALGRSPQPALALIRLESSKVKLAAAAIGAALAESSWDAMARLRLLGAQVEITLRAGDISGHGWRPTSWLRRSTKPAHPRCAPASPMPVAGCCWRRTTTASSRVLQAALRLWREVGSAYGIARTRAALSRATRGRPRDDDDARPRRVPLGPKFVRLEADADLKAEIALEERCAKGEPPLPASVPGVRVRWTMHARRSSPGGRSVTVRGSSRLDTASQRPSAVIQALPISQGRDDRELALRSATWSAATA